MTPEQLKSSILQFAIQGKLVEQRPEEGTGEELYQQIQAEKQRLIKEGKIKKEKAMPQITEDEIPFDIPESWKWYRLGALTYNWGQKTPDNRFCYVDVGSVNNISHTLNSENTVVEAKNASSRAKKIVNYGDVIFATIRPYLKNICIIDRDFPYEPIVSTAFAVMHCPEGLLNKYLYYYLLSPTFMSFANASDKAKGVAYPAIGEKDFFNGIIALPPFAEQERIVAKIEELLPYVDRYAVAYEKLEQFNAKFPEDMKKSILQYAIQGKLVEQRPEEGTGEELYHQIQAEKQRLIKEGKIKKEKVLPEIAEDEIPFDIPDSWKWVRLPEIGTSSLGKTLNKGLDVGSEVPYLCSINVYWEGISLNQIKTAKFSAIDMEKYLLRRGDLLICEGGDVGRSAVWDRDMEMYYQNALHCVRFFGSLNPYYFKYCLELYKHNRILENASKGMTIKHLVQGALYSIPFPLPPLDEQNRIVAKLEEILPLCERLK
jgi:type I restriction enzyme S subunit